LRRIERPRYGYYLDNSIDCVAQLLLAIGIGLSGYVRVDLCLLALVAYLMVSTLSLIRANVSGVFQISYAAVGPTEVRVGFVGLNALLIIFPPQSIDWGLPMTYPNLWSLARRRSAPQATDPFAIKGAHFGAYSHLATFFADTHPSRRGPLSRRRHHGRARNTVSSPMSRAAVSLAAIRSAVVLSISAKSRSPRARSRAMAAR
jgi:phosphatidylglycerophosphate synthase